LISGLTIACYLIPHLINHALGLVSISAMESMRVVLASFWQWTPVWWILPTSLLTHLVFSLLAVFRRATLRMPVSELCQLLMGLAVPLLLLGHIVGTRVTTTMTGMVTNYEYVLASMASSNVRVAMQSVLVIFVWVHLCIGLHMWLRHYRWYQRARSVLYALAVLLPTLSLLGFWRGLAEVSRTLNDPAAGERIFSEWFALGDRAHSVLNSLETILITILLVGVGSSLLVRWAVIWRNRLLNSAVIRHSSGKIIPISRGQSLLEAMRVAGVDHASVCGGRARCTTCRVQVSSGVEALPAPTAMEALALARIRAAPGVRLACQCYPMSDIDITPLVDPEFMRTGKKSQRGGVAGSEQDVVALFVDLRESTRLAEDKLPYDVVFILNRFFAEMSEALDDTGGLYAQFTGDGLLALYGLDSPLDEAARSALQGAFNMISRVKKMNNELESEITRPLKVGIGIHAGEAIVGDMGPPATPIRSAIGDNINIAARLESLTKEFACQLVVSQKTLEIAGTNADQFTRATAAIEGRSDKLPVCIYSGQ
jgi:adenylate cyclase